MRTDATRTRAACSRRTEVDNRQPAKERAGFARARSPRSGEPTRAKAELLPDYLPPLPTTLNFGRATTIFEGSDQDICWAPVGRFRLKPRTRYHHVPTGSGRTTDVPSVIVPSAPWFCGFGCGVKGYRVLLHCTS